MSAEPAAVVPEFTVHRTDGAIKIDGRLDEPSWIGAPAISEFQFPWWSSGAKELSVVKVLWNDESLFIACICSDQHITAVTKERDGPVPQDDCFEIMLAPNPAKPEVYFNLEWNVVGGLLDNFRPDGPKKPRAPRWDADNVQLAGTYLGTLNQDSDLDSWWQVEVAIPFANFAKYAAAIPPKAGTHWNANFNRHGGKTNPQYSQWSSGDTPTPSFHTPHRFGKLIFSAEPVSVDHARQFAVPPVEAVSRMEVPDGIRVTAFASEPEIRQPILVKCDDRGRVWVIQYLQYPNPAGLRRVEVDRWSRTVYDRLPDPPPKGPRGADKITICEDTDHDGRADKFTDFIDGLNLCTGLALNVDGAYVLQVPYLLFYPDRNQDDVPDSDPEVLLTGFGMEDAQSFANHLTWGPDGWLYGVNGSTTTCRIRDLEFQQGVWRYHPVTKEFELFCEGGGNLFGLTFDRHGQMLFTSNGGDLCMHGLQGAYYRKAFGKHGPLHNPYAYGYFADIAKQTPVIGGPCTGGTVYLAEQLPKPFHEAFLCGDFLGHTCSWWRLDMQGGTFETARGGTLIKSNDPWFGATDIGISPAGEVYISDFHDKRTAHPDPDANWDRSTGRIYRLTGTAAPDSATADGRQSPVSLDALVASLSDQNGIVREWARRRIARSGAEAQSRLREIVLKTEDEQLVLEALWALNGCQGLDDSTALQLLEHPNEHVRAWIVRLLGDRRSVSQPLAEQFAKLVESDTSPIVKLQLAATAKRLPGVAGLPVLLGLIESHPHGMDPLLTWMVWWGVESKVQTDAKQIAQHVASQQRQGNLTAYEILRHLVRRFAAEGTAAADLNCKLLIDAAQEHRSNEVLASLDQGLAERTMGSAKAVGQGDLFRASAVDAAPAPAATRTWKPLAQALHDLIVQTWLRNKTELGLLRVALRARVDQATEHVLEELKSNAISDDRRIKLLNLIAELGQPGCLPVVLTFFDPRHPEDVQMASLNAVQRFADSDGKMQLLERFSDFNGRARAGLSDMLLADPMAARALLQKVDRGELQASDVPSDSLRRVALHSNDELDALVRKHWGRIGAGTAEEKLAVMRRLNNDLRVTTGSPVAGKKLFQKHCASCHRLFDEGEKVGPDLTNTSRQDREYLLVSLVDPSAVVRRDYLTTTISTTGGEVLNGLIVQQDANQITVVDSKGQRRQLNAAEIEEMRDSETSLMPEGLAQQFSPAELRDLFAYVQSTR